MAEGKRLLSTLFLSECRNIQLNFFQPKISRKVRILSLGLTNNSLKTKKRVYMLIKDKENGTVVERFEGVLVKKTLLAGTH